MGRDDLNRWWLVLTAVLILVIVAAGVVFSLRRNPGQEILISSSNSPQFRGQILIDGAVSQPGFYPLADQDNIQNLVNASGGLAVDADLNAIRLYIPHQIESRLNQKVDINRAEVWLLEALPEIGATKALSIVEYRDRNGPYQNIREITRVQGISEAIFLKIKDLITVSD